MGKISAVYKIVNTVTGDSYVGSSKDVKRRWKEHKRPSVWKGYSNNQMYQDMQKYGLENFRFQILAPVEPEYLTQVEQEFIEMLNPTYNDRRSKGWNIERRRKTNKKYFQSDKGKEAKRKASYKRDNQLCSYNGEQLTLCALAKRFRKARVEHSTIEAKKYLIGDDKECLTKN